MGFFQYHISQNFDNTNKLRIKDTQLTGEFVAYRFQDADTSQYIAYIPSFEITGYGETMEKAMDMIRLSLETFFKGLTRISVKNRDAELTKLGWKKDPLKTKVFSNSYIDIEGKLQGFNPIKNSVERISLTA